MAVSDYSTTPSANTSIAGINVAENCSPAGINNAIRQLMADIAVAIGPTGLSTFMATVLDDPDANTARNTLGAATLENVTQSANGSLTIRVATTQIIIKWGQGTHSDSSGAQAVTFGTAFPNAALFGIASNAASAPPSAFHGCSFPSTTGLTVYSSTSSGVAAGAGTSFRWLAIGY